MKNVRAGPRGTPELWRALASKMVELPSVMSVPAQVSILYFLLNPLTTSWISAEQDIPFLNLLIYEDLYGEFCVCLLAVEIAASFPDSKRLPVLLVRPL